MSGAAAEDRVARAADAALVARGEPVCLECGAKPNISAEPEWSKDPRGGNAIHYIYPCSRSSCSGAVMLSATQVVGIFRASELGRVGMGLEGLQRSIRALDEMAHEKPRKGEKGLKPTERIAAMRALKDLVELRLKIAGIVEDRGARVDAAGAMRGIEGGELLSTPGGPLDREMEAMLREDAAAQGAAAVKALEAAGPEAAAKTLALPGPLPADIPGDLGEGFA